MDVGPLLAAAIKEMFAARAVLPAYEPVEMDPLNDPHAIDRFTGMVPLSDPKAKPAPERDVFPAAAMRD